MCSFTFEFRVCAQDDAERLLLMAQLSGRNVQGRPINSSKGGMHFLPLLSAEDQKEVSREREWGQDDAGGSGSEFDNPTFDISREEDSEQSDV